MPNTSPHLMAGGNIRPSRFVKMSGTATTGDNVGLEADAGENVIGIAMEGSNQPPLYGTGPDPAYAAASGQSFKLYGQGDICLLYAGTAANIVPGARVKSDADGGGVLAAVDEASGAICLEAPTADGQFFRVQVELHPNNTA